MTATTETMRELSVEELNSVSGGDTSGTISPPVAIVTPPPAPYWSTHDGMTGTSGMGGGGTIGSLLRSPLKA